MQLVACQPLPFTTADQTVPGTTTKPLSSIPRPDDADQTEGRLITPGWLTGPQGSWELRGPGDRPVDDDADVVYEGHVVVEDEGEVADLFLSSKGHGSYVRTIVGPMIFFS